MTCSCFENYPEVMSARVDQLCEQLSIDLIMVMLEEQLCSEMSEVVVGRMIAAIAARIFLMSIGPEEAKRLGDVDILKVPATRALVERLFIHARLLTEETLLARA